MNPLAPDPFHHIVETLGNTLLHSLWQGSLIALLLALVLMAVEKARTGLRYQICCAAFFALPLWMAATFASEWRHSPTGSSFSNSENVRTTIVPKASVETDLPFPSVSGNPGPAPWQSLATAVWIFGAAFFLIRLSAGWIRLSRVQRSAAPIAVPRINRLFAEACDRLGIRLRVRILSSDRISSPIMTGFLWPAIILPAGMLSGVPASHLQSIFAHELAHFRRWDYLVNLCQSFFDALLFYHPAAWWISRQIRVEREFACDQLAATLPGNDLRSYAGALAWMEQFRARPQFLEPAPGMVRDRRDTLSRIERLGSLRGVRDSSIKEGLAGGSTGLPWILLALCFAVFASAAPDHPEAHRSAASTIPGTELPSVFTQCEAGRRIADQSTRLVTEEVLWRSRIYRGREVPLFKSVIILQKGGKLFNLHEESPRLFPELPNHYLLDNRLNILDGNLPLRDPDGDGFTTLEEFRAGTRPNDAESHPDYAGKLNFVARHVQLYRVIFAAQPDGTRIQLNRLPTARWNRKTMILRLGEVSHDGQLRLEKLTPEGLKVTFLASGETFLLPKRKVIEIPTWFAELQLDLAGEEPFIVKLGKSFRLEREPGRSWKLASFEETGVRICEVASGESRVIGRSNGSEAPEKDMVLP